MSHLVTGYIGQMATDIGHMTTAVLLSSKCLK